jgi:hypothetical protein
LATILGPVKPVSHFQTVITLFLSMKPSWIQLTSVVLATEIFFTGCENLADVATETLSKMVDPSETNALQRGDASVAVVRIISTQIATERQRRMAEERALRADRELRAYRNELVKQGVRLKKPRYLAVNTARERNSAGSASIMIFDTEKQKLRETVSDLSEKPLRGKFLEIPSEIVTGQRDRDVINVPINVRDYRLPTSATSEIDSVLYMDDGEISPEDLAHLRR